jgi:hypothetical protein
VQTRVGAALAVLALAVAACGGPAATPAPTAGASLAPALSGSPVALPSPVTGVLVKIDSEGLTRVRGFRLRLADGTEAAFTIGILQNGAEFPPGHLAEHMSTSSPVRVFFRDEGGAHVVYRIEDG